MARIKQIKKEPSEDDIEIGDQVKHSKFGTGTVLYKSGSGERAKAIVVFPEEGQKKLLLRYAKMKKIKEAKSAEELPGELPEEQIIQALDDSVSAPKKKRGRKAKEIEEEHIEETDRDAEEEEEEEIEEKEADDDRNESTDEYFNE
ncbi:hypothetical protein JW926_00350 [Candidatus Sumerlaeota bacterium]|nr:hypothetical protein [Candidatus Sumerlaeota bacterium]